MLFPPISLKQLSRYLNRLWLVIPIIKFPRVAFISLKGSIGIILSYIGYLHRESVLITTPIPKLEFSTFHFYSSIILLNTFQVSHLSLRQL